MRVESIERIIRRATPDMAEDLLNGLLLSVVLHNYQDLIIGLVLN